MNPAVPKGQPSADGMVPDRLDFPTPVARQSAPFAGLRPVLYLAAGALLVTVLSLAQTFFVPLALAAMMGFILISPVAALERRGLHRLIAVTLVVLLVLGAAVGFGYVVSRQFKDFASHLPQYSKSIKAKIATLREARKGAIEKIQETVAAASHEFAKKEGTGTTDPATQEGAAAPGTQVQSAIVVPSEPSDVERLRLMLTPILASIATAGVVLILVIFILMQREDVRNRVIHLVGRGRVTVTTRTLDEAGHRISNYLFSQSVVNAAFGTCIAAGLLLIGVPYALLWGMTAAVLRFVPYLGSLLAMLMPAALAFVGSPGWGPTIETVALFLALDGFTAYVFEPVWIGTRTGVSSLALLISAIFWTWLWGPVGLLLSTPMTVCLAVVGKHIPELEFLAVLLGDEPPIEPDVTFYQRILAGDEDGASEILEQEISRDTREHVFDRVVAPALLLTERERLRGEISYDERQFVMNTLLEILRTSADTVAQGEDSGDGDLVPQHRILGVPARSASDHLALEMLRQLGLRTWQVDQLSTTALVSEVLLAIDETPPDVMIVTALPPGGLSRVRHLCKRVHERFPDLPILILRAGANADAGRVARDPTSDGRIRVATSFTEALAHLAQLIPSSAELPAGFVGETLARPDMQPA